MPVRMFEDDSATHDTPLEEQINAWMGEHPHVYVWYMALSTVSFPPGRKHYALMYYQERTGFGFTPQSYEPSIGGS